MQKKIKITSDNYDELLKTLKENKFRRIEKFINSNVAILHQCNDDQCNKQWKKKPNECIKNNFYCYGCIKHNDTNIERFNIDRLSWTKHIKDNFYILKLTNNNKSYYIINRSLDDKYFSKYNKNFITSFNVKIFFAIKTELILSTQIENYWISYLKNIVKEHFTYQTFSFKCYEISDDDINYLINKSNELINNLKKT